MKRISGDWINNDAAQSLCRAISSAGHQIYFVGGCVRNDLLNVPISDLDMSTDARPEQVQTIADKAGFRTIPTGIEHGTITVIIQGQGFEVTSFRKDIQTDGRRAVVAFSTNIEDDARRRDFTMNALYAQADGTIIDPLNSYKDLHARRICFIDDANERIREDYLRTLRFFRFYAWYGDPKQGIDAEGLAAVAQNIDGLSTLSKERVGAEMLKLLSAPDPARALASMAQSGVLNAILPGATIKDIAPLIHLEHPHTINPIRRLAALGGDAPSDRFRLSKRDQKKLHVLRSEISKTTSVGELAYRHGAENATDIMLLRACQFGTGLDAASNTQNLAQINTGTQAIFPVSAKDLADHYSGKALGDQLRHLEAIWIASEFQLSRAELLK